MDARQFLVKAQAADAIANAAQNSRDRHRWEVIAAQFRWLAKAVADEQKARTITDPSEH